MRIVDFLYGVPYMFLVILVMLLFSDTARGEPLPVFVALGPRAVAHDGAHRARRRCSRSASASSCSPRASRARRDAPHPLRATSCPNALGPVVVYATLTVPAVILLESFLSLPRARRRALLGPARRRGRRRS